MMSLNKLCHSSDNGKLDSTLCQPLVWCERHSRQMFPVWSRRTAMPWLLLLAVPVFTTDGSSVSEPHPYDAVWDDVVEGEGLVSMSVENATGVEMEQKRTPSKKGVRWHTHSRKWTASISFASSQRYLGIFEKEVNQDYF